jgi:predicted HTH transcriptional regulator
VRPSPDDRWEAAAGADGNFRMPFTLENLQAFCESEAPINGYVTCGDVVAEFGIHRKNAWSKLMQLVASGVLRAEGNRKARRYYVVNDGG